MQNDYHIPMSCFVVYFLISTYLIPSFRKSLMLKKVGCQKSRFAVDEFKASIDLHFTGPIYQNIALFIPNLSDFE